MLSGSAGGDESPALKHVLIVADEHDPETDRLVSRIQARGGTFVRINSEELPESTRVTCDPRASVSAAVLTHRNGTASLADFSAAWAPGFGRSCFGHPLDERTAIDQALQDWSWALGDLARWMP